MVQVLSSHERGGLVCAKVYGIEQQRHRYKALSSLNHCDGYPVTWVVEVGQTTVISMSFQRSLTCNRKAGKGEASDIIVSLNEK